MTERSPDHSTLSRTRRLIDVETHEAVFTWVLERLAEVGLVAGKTVGIDATTLEANAAMRSIERRDTGETHEAFIRRLAEASGVETPTRADLARFDRSRKNKKTSNKEWKSPQDPDAKIAKMKDGRTHLAHKAEHGVDMDTGAIVSVTVQDASDGDTATLPETLIMAAEQVRRFSRTEFGGRRGGRRQGLSQRRDAGGAAGGRCSKPRIGTGARPAPLAGQEDGGDASGEASCAECRAFFGWRRGGHRPKVTGRVTAPLTEKWIGRNRCPDARLWALHGREALLARGLPVVRGRCRLTAVGDDAYEGLPAAVGRGRRRKSTGPTLRDQQEAAPGGLGWARHDESRKAGRPQASAKWSTACMFPSWHRGHRRNERPVNAS